MRIAFLLQEIRLGACGLTDYSVRMAEALTDLGHEIAVLCVGSFDRMIHPTPDGGEVVFASAAEHAPKDYDVLSVQYVPPTRAAAGQLFALLRETGHPRIHLMIHEFWRISTEDYQLTARERVRSFLQRSQLRKLIRRTCPDWITASNSYYSQHLNRAGIRAVVLPMPGTIAIGDHDRPDDPALPPEWFRREGNTFLWVIFGSLYTNFWDCDAYFREILALSKIDSRKHSWVICGKQSEGDKRKFLEAASSQGYGENVHFTGMLAAKSVDWALRQSDGSLSGTSVRFWEKSTGALVVIERGVPIYFPRECNTGLNFEEPLLFSSLGEMMGSHRGNYPNLNTYDGSHTANNSAKSMISLLDNPACVPAHGPGRA